MKNLKLLLILSLPISQAVAEWNVGLEIAEIDIKGSRTFNAPEFNSFLVKESNASQSIQIPFIAYSPSESSTLKLRYSEYDRFETLGFGKNNFPPELVTTLPLPNDYYIEEKIEEYTLSYLYRAGSFKGVDLSFGPCLSYFVSDHTLTVSNINETPRIISTTRERLTEYKVGFEGALSYKISDRIRTDLTYRFSSPTERDFHLISLSVAYKL